MDEIIKRQSVILISLKRQIRFWLIALFSLFSSVLYSKTDSYLEPVDVASGEQTVERHIAQAYRLSKKNIEIILIGTFHSSNSKVIEIAKVFEDEVANSDVFLMEVNRDETINGDIGRYYYNRGDRLSRSLSQKAYDYYKNLLSGRIKGGIERLSPMTVYIYSVLPDEAFSDLALVMDDYLAQIARDNEVPIFGLESFEEQMMALYDLGDATVLRMLENQAQNPVDSRKDLMGLQHAYLKGDLNAVYDFSKKIPHELPQRHRLAAKVYLDQLIEGRNLLMWQRLSQMMASGKYSDFVVAVGAAHLIGELGILNLAKNAGFTVRPYN